MTNILFLGLGEVGGSVSRLYTDTDNCNNCYTLYYKEVNNYNNGNDCILNIEKEISGTPIDVLHVSIPFINTFTNIVTDCIKKYNPYVTYIHSTTVIGVTTDIAEQTGTTVIHTPVMGVHPNLTESMRTFKKIFGVKDPEYRRFTIDHFKPLGVTPEFYEDSTESEAAKLFSTSYYGHLIRYMQEVHEYCTENDYNFENVYTKTNEIYNEGYGKMNMHHVKRPILKYMGTGIGRHCVTSNALILHQLDEKMNIPKLIASGGYNIPENLKDLPKYQVKDWLFCEYVGKEKSTIFIGEECGVSNVTIRNWLKKFEIPIRVKYWTEEEDKMLIELSQEITFKEIAESGHINKTYEQIRNRAYTHLNLKSVYDPSVRDEETRKKISCTLRDIDYDNFDDFLWKQQTRIHRKEYSDWRKEVLERDDYTCQKTKIKGGRLNVHHIVSWENDENLRFDIDNGIVLSEDSHIEFHKKYGYRNATKENLEKYLNVI